MNELFIGSTTALEDALKKIGCTAVEYIGNYTYSLKYENMPKRYRPLLKEEHFDDIIIAMNDTDMVEILSYIFKNNKQLVRVCLNPYVTSVGLKAMMGSPIGYLKNYIEILRKMILFRHYFEDTNHVPPYIQGGDSGYVVYGIINLADYICYSNSAIIDSGFTLASMFLDEIGVSFYDLKTYIEKGIFNELNKIRYIKKAILELRYKLDLNCIEFESGDANIDPITLKISNIHKFYCCCIANNKDDVDYMCKAVKYMILHNKRIEHVYVNPTGEVGTSHFYDTVDSIDNIIEALELMKEPEFDVDDPMPVIIKDKKNPDGLYMYFIHDYDEIKKWRGGATGLAVYNAINVCLKRLGLTKREELVKYL